MNWTDDRNQPQARVLLDSVSPEGVRLTTFEVTMHRFVLAEFNTHRVFSRNSASSRAIPFTKQMDRATMSPVEWRAAQRGMQGGDLLEDTMPAISAWYDARNEVLRYAEFLHEQGVHKSIINRLIEPWLPHNVIVTATEWDGFWEQRCSPLAQPEIRVAAEAMHLAYDNSTPREIEHGQWHTPLIQPDEDDEFWHNAMCQFWSRKDDAHDAAARGQDQPLDDAFLDAPEPGSPVEARKAVSAARCARVSYLTHDGERDVMADLELYARLATARPGHWSPFEHVATPCPRSKATGVAHYGPDGGEHLGNLRGWDQYRHEVSTGANA